MKSMLTENQKQLHKYKHLLKLKGDNSLAGVREIMIETMKDIRNGKCPLDAAKEIHLAGHRAVMDVYADCKRLRMGIQQKTMFEAMEAMRQVSKVE